MTGGESALTIVIIIFAVLWSLSTWYDKTQPKWMIAMVLVCAVGGPICFFMLRNTVVPILFLVGVAAVFAPLAIRNARKERQARDERKRREWSDYWFENHRWGSERKRAEPDDMPIEDGELERCMALLRITASLPDELVKKRYRELARLFHPDLHDGKEHFEEQMKEINHAYQVVMEHREGKRHSK